MTTICAYELTTGWEAGAHTSFHSLRPQEADEELNFEEQILEAAKSIAAATSALVKSASAAQKELVAQGKLSSNPTSEDGQWSEGLVSAVSALDAWLCVH